VARIFNYFKPMKNPENFGVNTPQDDSIWQMAKPSNPWTPNTDKAWQKVSMNLGATAVSASLLSTTPVKTIAKFTVKKLLLWGAVGASVIAGTVYQMKQSQKKAVSTTVKTIQSKIVDPTQATVDEKTTTTQDVIHIASRKSEINTAPSIHSAPQTNKNNPLPNSKILQFKQTELLVVAEILSQNYGVTIKIEKPQLMQCKLTATFDNEPIQNILEIIQETFNIEIVSEKETIWLKGGSCQ
jgi:ferric-dicitrate binding protein FerR (iron transport regulator)